MFKLIIEAVFVKGGPMSPNIRHTSFHWRVNDGRYTWGINAKLMIRRWSELLVCCDIIQLNVN